MSAVDTDLTIEQGTTWSYGFQVTYEGAALGSGWTGRSQVRESRGSSKVLHTFTVTIADSVVTLTVTPTDSESWTWQVGVYDVEIEHTDGRVLRVAEGSVVVSPDVTRE